MKLTDEEIEIKETYTSKIGAWKMNREIIFKAKRKDNGEWVEGFVFEFKGEFYIMEMTQTFMRAYYSEESVVDFNMRAVEIDPDTICWYIGLKDKNGKKIWENDIVKCRHSQSFGNVKWYCGDYIGWCVDDVYDCEQQFDKDMFDTCEVIGNVFDNPELLEVE